MGASTVVVPRLDQRGNERLKVKAIVRYRDVDAGDEVTWGVTDDISAGGLRLVSGFRLTEGSHVALEVLALSAATIPFCALGRVMWSDRREAGAYAIGIQFLWLGENAQTALAGLGVPDAEPEVSDRLRPCAAPSESLS